MILMVLGLLVFSLFIRLVVAIVLVQTDPAKPVVGQWTGFCRCRAIWGLLMRLKPREEFWIF